MVLILFEMDSPCESVVSYSEFMRTEQDAMLIADGTTKNCFI